MKNCLNQLEYSTVEKWDERFRNRGEGEVTVIDKKAIKVADPDEASDLTTLKSVLSHVRKGHFKALTSGRVDIIASQEANNSFVHKIDEKTWKWWFAFCTRLLLLASNFYGIYTSWRSNFYYWNMGSSISSSIMNTFNFIDWFGHFGVIRNLKPWERFGPESLLPPLEQRDDSKGYYEEWRE